MPRERIGVSPKCHVNVVESQEECKGVGVMCQGNAGECQGNTEWVLSAM